MVLRIFTLFMLLGLAFSVNAQRDLIITQAGEQIRCRIVDESSMRFSYMYVNDKGKTVKTEIFKTLISSFKYNYFPEDQVTDKKASAASDRPAAKRAVASTSVTKTPSKNTPGETAAVKNNPAGNTSASKTPTKAVNGNTKSKDKLYSSPLKGKTEFTNYLKYRVGLKGGLGNIMDDNSDKSAFGRYNEKLRRGWVYGVDAAVFLNDHFGLGATYQSFHASNKNADLNDAVGAEMVPIKSLESKVNHKFVGPTLLGRVAMDYKTFVVATVSPGYYFYSDKGIVNQMNYEYKGGAWGGAATLGIDFLIGNDDTGRDVILSFECGYNYGKLREINPEKTWHELPIQMNRLDFAVGLRFTRFPRYLR